MAVIETQKTKYRDILRNQNIISKEIDQLKNKIRILGFLKHFERLAEKARFFVKQKNIRLKDVLEND